jgi:hypothetical protein
MIKNEKCLEENRFRSDLRSFTHFVISRFGIEEKTSISIAEGESLDIDPSFNYGVILRLVSHDDRSGYEHRFSFVLRRSADIDLVDDRLGYVPLEKVDRFEATTRLIKAQEALANITRI